MSTFSEMLIDARHQHGHKWKKVTRKDEWSHWTCQNCGHKVRRNVKYQPDSPPTMFDLNMDVRSLTCEEMIVQQVHQS